jgi:hypothetical protein
MLGSRVHCGTAVHGSNCHWDWSFTAEHISEESSLIHHLFDNQTEEIRVHYLSNRSGAGKGSSSAATGDSRFTDWGVDDALFSELIQ